MRPIAWGVTALVLALEVAVPVPLHASGIGSTSKADIISLCCKPLLESDLLAIDRVADGRLYVSELLPGELECLVERLVRTNDPVMRDGFRWFIQNDVWEMVRAHLIELQKSGGLEDGIQEKVDDLLGKEYSDDAFFVSGYLRYAFEGRRVLTLSGDAREGYGAETHSLKIGAAADGAFEAGAWKIEPYLSASGTQLWTAERLDSPGRSPDAKASSYQGAGGSASIAVRRRDEKAKVGGYGFLEAYRDPPPDETVESYGAGGNLQFREIGGSALSLRATADWYVDDRTPLGEGYFDPYLEILCFYGEAAYMWEAAGLLATYERNDIASTDTVLESALVSDSGSLLAHVPLSAGFLRIGIGGGYWSEDTRFIGGAPSISSGGEAHARLTGDFELTTSLRMDFSVEVRANQSAGTFVGWYPSGDARIGATLAVGDLSLGAGVSASGEHRDLNEEQDAYALGANGEASFAPVDYFRASLSGGWRMSRQSGYSPYSASNWWGQAAIGLRIVEAIDLWLTTEGGLNGAGYETPDGLRQESLGAVVMERISIRY